ncbi:MAG: glycine cleavage system protein GcvH [Armatimonadota bacterium]|nr:glycine cleavage system protein GcvH [Armatimonadota bacterium]
MQIPDDRRYTETHEWAMQDGELVRVGITAFAMEQLGDVIFLDLPEPSTPVSQGAPFGEIESVKAVAELFAPISGEVTEANEGLIDDLDQIAEDPWGAWMIAVAPSDISEMEQLLDAGSYAGVCEEEA